MRPAISNTITTTENTTTTETLKSAQVDLKGGWIQILDRETLVVIGSDNFPSTSFKTFAKKIVKKYAALGYRVETTTGMGGFEVVKIG